MALVRVDQAHLALALVAAAPAVLAALAVDLVALMAQAPVDQMGAAPLAQDRADLMDLAPRDLEGQDLAPVALVPLDQVLAALAQEAQAVAQDPLEVGRVLAADLAADLSKAVYSSGMDLPGFLSVDLAHQMTVCVYLL